MKLLLIPLLEGVYDVLEATDGQKHRLRKMMQLRLVKSLEEIEEIDVLTPAKVALASLIQAKKRKSRRR